MKINKPLIVFGRDTAETYPLLLAIAKRREKEQAWHKRKAAAKSFVLAFFRNLFQPQSSHE